jgi:hypothetical protein
MPSLPELATMPAFTIETTFLLPVFRHRSISADTLEEACRRALADEDWWDQKHDYDNSRPTYVSGAWLGDDAAYRGPELSVPSVFAEIDRRKDDHFGVLLHLLKSRAIASDIDAQAAIAKADAILARAAHPT